MRYVEVFVLSLVLCEARNWVPRVVQGDPDCDKKFSYVGAFIARRIGTFKNIRTCTGSLISSQWVLTAAHCIKTTELTNLYFAYGDLSTATYKGNVKKVLREETPISHGMGKANRNDIGLVMIDAVKLNQYAKLSSVDARSLIGYPVEYAGAGGTYSEKAFANKKLYRKIVLNDQYLPVQIGTAVIAKCNDHYWNTPSVCLRPKCDERRQYPQREDAGGPLVYNGKIIAIAAHPETLDMHIKIIGSRFTPISSYLDWIVNTITVDKKET